MKIRTLLFLLCILTLVSCSQKPAEIEQKDIQTIAVEFVEFVNDGDYKNVSELLDSTMTEVFGEELMNSSWENVKVRFGEFGELVEMRTETVDGYEIVFLIYDFSKCKVEVKVVFDSEKKVAGFFAYPLQGSYLKPLPAYIDTLSFDEKSVNIGEGEWILPGTYTTPKNSENFPVLILVHGSGPNDRDATLGPNKFFRDLSWGLATAGIAVLRYDKRTFVYPQKINDDVTLEHETIEDAISAAEYLIENEGVDSSAIFIAGHSLGGMAIPAIASKTPYIGGFIIMAGNTRGLAELTREQLIYIFNLDSFTMEESLFLDTLNLKMVNLNKISEDTLISNEDLPFGIPQAYWLYLKNYNQIAEAKKIKKPVLIIQGERDYQVTMEDFMGWKNNLGHLNNFSFKSYPGLNHNFMDGEGQVTPDEYLIPNYVSQNVVSDIIGWIEKNHR
ncbi:DUF3887 domain-containing protein [candidate division WOR-3 bacterium]|nr:DUF3887 domain-containing protein [candidate division WOR-3 bacterium]